MSSSRAKRVNQHEELSVLQMIECSKRSVVAESFSSEVVRLVTP